ncbi:MAG TPA: glycosyl hydrolase 53 family protein [Bacteroidales bacterium]|nr:glycosyl hydrolase 53 family protein [Bacteroidales bacterium]
MKLTLSFLSILLLAVQCSTERTQQNYKDWSSTYQVDTGVPVSIAITTYKTTMLANGKDHVLIRATAIDSTGKEIRNADLPIHIYITGDATVAELPDGQSMKVITGEDSVIFRESGIINGTCSFYFVAGTKPDRIKLEVRSDSLWPASHEIHTISPDFKSLVPTKAQLKTARKEIARMLGADISFLPQMEERGMKFIVDGEEKDAVQALADQGFNCIRLRIFVNPENEKGYSPQKGFCGMEYTKQMARRTKDAGMKILLNFHYSDYWADPQQQNKPLAWQDLGFEQLKLKVGEYTKEVLLALKEQGTMPEMVQIGNEINHGMLWPDGHISNPDQLAELLKVGVEAVREVDPKTIIMMHIALGGQNDESVFWLDNMIARDVKFDIIGLSYYPRWHGTLDDLQKNLFDLVKRYNKPVNVVEYAQYPEEIHEIVFSLPDDAGEGTCNWEPLRSMFGRDGVANENLFVYKAISEKYYGVSDKDQEK